MKKRSAHREAGNAIVEMALVLPLLVMLAFGVVEFGRAYNAQITVTHAAREGVRVLALTQDGGAAADAARKAATSLDPTLVTVDAGVCNPGYPTTVVVTYPFTYEVPLFGTSTISLTGRGVMRCGG